MIKIGEYGYFSLNERKSVMSLYDFIAIGDNITSESSLGERAETGLQVMLIGMAVVFGVLILLMAILYIFKAFALKGQKEDAVESVVEQPKAVATNAAAPAASQGGEEETAVAIATAAIAASRGESEAAFNVLSIKKIVK